MSVATKKSPVMPAYTTFHPRVLIDEAHHNFHTSSGRYKTFAGLIANDGYQVLPNRDPFASESLRKCDILVVANAMAAETMRSPGADKSAFTDDECKAVHDWVKSGGALLLITDHEPFGSSAENLGRQFGVEMSKAVAVDTENTASDTRGLVFSRDKKLLGDHPITAAAMNPSESTASKRSPARRSKVPKGVPHFSISPPPR